MGHPPGGLPMKDRIFVLVNDDAEKKRNSAKKRGTLCGQMLAVVGSKG